MTRHRRRSNGHHEHHERVSEHALALVKATEESAEEKVTEARDKLAKLLADAKEGVEYVEEQAEEGLRQADSFVRAKPYQAVGLALGLGALLGFFFARRK